MITINSKRESWKIAGTFRISHGTYSVSEVISVRIFNGELTGRGECRPYARYGETPESVLAQIETAKAALQGKDADDALADLQNILPAGAARNALDCALWDLKCKTSGKRIWDLLDIPAPTARTTAFTLSIDSPSKMAKAAREAHAYPVLKLKIGGPKGLAATIAVMDARPDAQIILDANEALSPADIPAFQSTLAPYPVLMVEQPLKASEFDGAPIDPQALPMFCADESAHTSADLQKLWDAGYRGVNVKLDKCGGISEGIAMIRQAKAMGFVIMCGCMVGTSLAMAPMMALTAFADVIDLDGPLLLAKDIENGLRFEGPTIYPPEKSLWG